ncbi:MAG: tRNA (5-methylaminomethyl-2-thiouridine)(34)-methyltransferase MnmD [Spirosomataceae bacterium]
MNTRFFITADGSHTLYNEALNAHYHSVHGALQESQHIFIDLGFKEALRRRSDQLPGFATPLTVFEMGFGTGLNALLTLHEAEKAKIPVHYAAVEAYPVTEAESWQLNYDSLFQTEGLALLHRAGWGEPVPLSPYFTLEKHPATLQDFTTPLRFDAVYYDAFAPEVQPELWTREIFEKIALWLNPGGNLTTYCSKGYVQRHLKAAGFTVEKHPGPAWKREVLRAIRP